MLNVTCMLFHMHNFKQMGGPTEVKHVCKLSTGRTAGSWAKMVHEFYDKRDPGIWGRKAKEHQKSIGKECKKEVKTSGRN